MRGPKPAMLELNEREREELEALVRKHRTPQQIALRGRMILLAAQGKRNAQIARELGACVDTVRSWRMRWINWQKLSLDDFSVSERLSDTPRPGRPARITTEQFCQLIAFACEQPKERPITHWTGREIAEEVMERGILTSISPRHASRLLKRGTFNPI
jgi:putative transposase